MVLRPQSAGELDAIVTPAVGPDAIVAPAVRSLDQLAEQLVAWLGDRIPAATQLRVSGLTYPRGSGQSHETVLFDAHWVQDGVAQQQGLAVRIKPTRFTVFHDDMFAEEFRLMHRLRELGIVPVATVRWYEDDASILGSPFFVMDKIAGRVAVSVPSYMDTGWVAEATPAERATLWRNCVRALAEVQAAPVDAFPFLDLSYGGTGFEQEWRRWESFLESIDRPDRPLPAFRSVWARLGETTPTNRPEGLVWGDARLGNMMIGDEFEVVALMDWEQPSLGGALHDLGWWLFNQHMKILTHGGQLLSGMPDRAETIDLWREVTGISTESIEWYEASAGFKMACLAVNMLDLRGMTPRDGDYAGLIHLRTARAMLQQLDGKP